MHKWCKPLVLLLLTLAIGQAGARAAELPLDVYGQLPVVSNMAIAPGGDRIAFHRTASNVDAVYVLDRSTGKVIGGVDGSQTHLRDMSFLDHDRLFLYAEEAQHVHVLSRKVQATGSFIYDVKTNEFSALLENSRRLYNLQTGVGRIVGHNAARDAVYMPAYIERGHGRQPTYGLLEVTPDHPRGRVIESGTADTDDWFVDDEGRIVVQEEYNEHRKEQRIWHWQGDDRTLIFESGDDRNRWDVVGLTLDMQSLVVSARISGIEYYRLFEMNLADGSVGPPLFERDGASVERTIMDLSRRVYGVGYTGFFPRYEFFDKALTERVRKVQSSMPITSATLIDWTPDFGYLLFFVEGGWSSGAYVVAEPGTDKPVLLSTARLAIPTEAVVPTSVEHYAAADGLDIPALVTARPDVRNAGKAPLIVMPHGGPEAQDRYGFDWIAQYFASRGIVVLQPQFRGSSGFGDSLRRAGLGQWGRAMSTDLDDGVRFLVDQGLVDADRVCVLGLSYGGYAALAAGAFSPFNYRCLASVGGVSDLPGMLHDEREFRGRDSRSVAYWKKQFGIVDKPDKAADEISPVNFAENFRAPVLLVHGHNDAVVSVDQSRHMYRALKRAKKPVEFVELDGEDHYLSGYETRMEALKVVAAFIEIHLSTTKAGADAGS